MCCITKWTKIDNINICIFLLARKEKVMYSNVNEETGDAVNRIRRVSDEAEQAKNNGNQWKDLHAVFGGTDFCGTVVKYFNQ